jgi:hypothetical protein
MMGWLAIQAWYGNELFGVYWVTRGGLWSVDAPFWTAPTVHQILVTLGGLGSLNLGTATMLPKTFCLRGNPLEGPETLARRWSG